MNSTTKQLQDTDLFPFGKYHGKKMEDVPADYLDFIHGQAWISKYPAVLDYIERNRKVIDKELKEQGRIP
jgi:Putative quorum-sensing-regulated virulence factor